MQGYNLLLILHFNFPMFLYCSSVPTVPLYLLFLRTLCSCVPTVPLYPLFLWSTVALYPLFLCSCALSVPLYPLFLCSSVPSVPVYLLFLCTHCSSDPLFLSSSAPSVALYLLFLWGYYPLMFNYSGARYIRDYPNFSTDSIRVQFLVASFRNQIWFVKNRKIAKTFEM